MNRFLQLALDFFDPSPEAHRLPASAPAAPSGPAPAGDLRPRAGQGPRRPAPAQPQVPDAAVAPQFRHPRANRESLIGPTRVGYELQRVRRRTIGFVVGPEGLTVRAPRWVPLHEIDSALQTKAGWILRRLDDARVRRERLDAARIEWRDGAQVPVLGDPVRIVLDPSQARPRTPGTRIETGADGVRELRVGLSHQAEPAQIRDVVQAWLMREAERVFLERLAHYATPLGVRWTRLRLSSAGTRWGSAHADGTIRLNWRLIHFRLPVIDYVVAHELSHLRVMDHSPRFWETVASVVPDYAHRRNELKEHAIPDWSRTGGIDPT